MKYLLSILLLTSISCVFYYSPAEANPNNPPTQELFPAALPEPFHYYCPDKKTQCWADLYCCPVETEYHCLTKCK